MTEPDPAPEGFEFDESRLEAAAVAAFQDGDPDMHRELTAGRLAWAAELDDDRHVMVRVTDKATGALLGTLELPWQDVCRLN
jgi:hypothetical protein